jgi:predicted nucleotidyltransferase
MYLFLSIIVQMCHDQRDKLKDYWSTLEQLFIAFYGNTMKRDRFFRILRYMHFSDNRNELDKTGKNYDKFSNSIYQRNTNDMGQNSTGYVILRDIHTTCQCI